MEITPVQKASRIKTTASVSSATPNDALSLSSAAGKMEGWLTTLQQMPDIRPEAMAQAELSTPTIEQLAAKLVEIL